MEGKNRPLQNVKRLSRNCNDDEGKIKIERTREKDWKSTKYLGTMLGTEEDFKRTKQVAIAAYNKLKHTIERKKTSRN